LSSNLAFPIILIPPRFCQFFFGISFSNGDPSRHPSQTPTRRGRLPRLGPLPLQLLRGHPPVHPRWLAAVHSLRPDHGLELEQECPFSLHPAELLPVQPGVLLLPGVAQPQSVATEAATASRVATARTAWCLVSACAAPLNRTPDKQGRVAARAPPSLSANRCFPDRCAPAPAFGVMALFFNFPP